MTQSHQQSDPIDAALKYQDHMSAYVDKIEEAEAEEAAAQQAELEAQQQEDRALEAVTVSRSTTRLPALLITIRANESGGNYTAVNNDPDACEGYGCYGAYQMHGEYMGDWAARYGHPEVVGTPANQWPASTQDDVALGLFYSTNPDGAHWCDWTDYC